MTTKKNVRKSALSHRTPRPIRTPRKKGRTMDKTHDLKWFEEYAENQDMLKPLTNSKWEKLAVKPLTNSEWKELFVLLHDINSNSE